MNIEQLEYIVFVASENSITNAAKKLNISPSAISQSITQLEKELNITIFNRSRAGTTPTNEGLVVITRAINILSNLRELNNELSLYKNTKKTHLKISTSPTFFQILPDAIVKLNKINNHITYEIVESSPEDIMKNFERDNDDIGFLAADEKDLIKDEKCGYLLLHHANLCIIVGKDSKFFSYDYVTPADLNNQNLILYKNTNNQAIQEISKNNTNQVLLSSNKDQFLLKMLVESDAFAYTHEFTLKNSKYVKSGALRIIPIKKNKPIKQEIWAVYSKSKGLSEPLKALIEILKNEIMK